ncbi:hypothetical protein EJ05DRAFT_507536 [Pseudovirgaria hyperparasitica]|uniref:Sas10 C-terminal domain-containing protein n=1 Tax=Pseudovirgaria hyperparasitica TaxID=470096 RepID=A0A6A6WIK2_9PEZI|nr:uncharacterized protein EJ05DRAFT_507536 [Pseudovirgaria hyperparasitica]KAF2761924.1 hypothetical protein EJ05DRAFT_507536 [Pseudovirgaria hyperparasitica]
MGKKRKAGKPSGQIPETDVVEKPSKLNIRTYEDVADSEDEFLLNRDKVLLDEGPEVKRQRKQREKDEFLELDEEALNYAEASDSEGESEEDELEDDDDDDMEDGADQADSEDDLDEQGWGQSKNDYYGADEIEREEEALEEEAEALRMQKKQLQSMTDADYGFDEEEWAAGAKKDIDDDDEGVVTQVLPQKKITDMSSDEQLKELKTRYPEFDPLSKELVALQPTYNRLSVSVAAAQKLGVASHTSRRMIKYQALASYLSSIAMYFALLTSTFSDDKNIITAKAPKEIREHPVIHTLIQCQTIWNRVKDLAEDDEDTELSDIEEVDEVSEKEVTMKAPEPSKTTLAKKAATSKKKTKAEKAVQQAKAEAEARKVERKRKTEEDLAALSSLTKQIKSKKFSEPQINPSKNAEDDSDLGDEIDLTAEELAEKAKKRKSLKFYTSQITQKSNKRDASRRDYGGDMDVPHRERLRDRQQRLNAEAVKRGKNQKGDDLGGESDEEDHKQAREIRGDDKSDDDEYYDMVAARSKKRKLDKQDRAEAFAQAAREGGEVIQEEVIGPDGRREISYQISKNKGLTPKRKKDVRNPRVKKRKKYDEKKKKLKSMKPVYSGGEGRGGYKGELTGIKKGLVKSVKL